MTLDWLLVHLKPNRWMAIENDRESILDEGGDLCCVEGFP